MSFGRKGLAPGAVGAAVPAARPAGARSFQPAGHAAPARRAAPAAPVDDDPYRAQREAFLAAERARRLEAGEAGGEDAYDDVRPAARRARESAEPIPYPRRAATRHSRMFGDPAQRSLLLAYVFWNFGAAVGMHRFYCGASESAWYQMALFYGGLVVALIWAPLGIAMMAGWFLWILADLFLIPGMMRRLKAAHRMDEAEVFA
ncbi:TM2 domain-containing protein [Erythrobacter sp. WG]|uniref:TM2 domain-containing protein n=1 Tax=Erythrobacter sp. WG TaxID=2985510 RepID=UPI00226DED38|nr:TM2 domain-containing protein [Erythrobacter sp. WG]MCX9148569.1 TM2 domain-containing protein [Erythrobacter sp. WG]